MRIFNTAVYMTFSSEIHDIVKLIFAEEAVSQVMVTDISFYKDAAFVVYILGYCLEIACICQGIQYDNLDIIVFGQHILQVIGPDEAGCSCN